MVQAQYGNFDSLNPFSVRGNVARNLRERVLKVFSNAIMTKPLRSTLACRKSVHAPDRSYVTFTLNPAAKFSDGTQVTTEDVALAGKPCATRAAPTTVIITGG